MEEKYRTLGQVMVIFFLLFTLALSVSLISERTSLFGKAESLKTLGKFSPENSYVFTSPLTALANGQEKIRITVFLLDTEGLGVEGKRIYLGQTSALNIQDIQPVTDSYGKAFFDISSLKAGEYYIEVGVERIVLPSRARITFRLN